jgi:hypothetical protein
MTLRHLLPPAALLATAFVFAACSEDAASPTVDNTLKPSPAAVGDLRVTAGAAGSLELAWTSPALPVDDGGPIVYELRHCDPGREDEPIATWSRLAAPARDDGAGLAHAHTVTGLTPDHTYLLRLRARVGGGPWSAESNTVVATAAVDHDRTRPARVTELRQWAGTGSSLTVAWAAAGDDSLYGEAAAYEVRWHALSTTWDNMTPAAGPVVPASKPGWWQTTLDGLDEEVVYRIRVRAADEVGHLSAPSVLAELAPDTMRVWYVNVEGTGDAPTIEAAVDSAGMGDLILVAPGRYTWTNQGTGDPQYGIVWIKQNKVGFELRGEEGPEATIIDGEGIGPVIHVAGAVLGPGEEVPTWPGIVIDGFTLTGGNATGAIGVTGQAYAGGGLVFHLSNAVLRNLIIHDNEATQGGGLWFGGQGIPVIENCEIYDNRAVRHPDYLDGSGLGGGVLLANNEFGVTMRDCVVRDNVADYAGGGVIVGAGPRDNVLLLDMENVAITGNAADYGGGLYLGRLGEGSEFRHVSITGNTARLQGGGIFAWAIENEHRFANCTIAGNQAALGSALRLSVYSMLIFDNCIIADNTGSRAFSVQSSSGISAACTVVHGHPDDSWPTLFVDRGGNLNLAPGFCGSTNYGLRASSPCLPGNHPDGAECGLIGAMEEGCQ